jgi:hypothetical protein
MYWMETKDGDAFARPLADRHYSRKTIGAIQYVGPGERMVLISPDYKALFAWRISIFRNESEILSSLMIKEAVELAKSRWPNEKRFFTYVRDSAIKSSNPGCCFKKAGWKTCGRNKTDELTILEYVA